ncbi:MAG: phytanoyl-CoA dioxygenase family protein [Planctomycetota bacterium]|nr:phytanoyl-CoA dioxygenase family protein [Planctomycetota bacterium]
MTSKGEIIETVREKGLCCLPDFLTPSEIEETRQDFTRAFTDAGHENQQPGVRARLSGEHLLKYPCLARVYGHPRILELASRITEEPQPYLQEIVVNRYLPPHPGVGKHLDEDFNELIPPFMRVTWALFLDDISAESGALTYAPGTHWNNYLDENIPGKKSPTNEEVAGAEYIPAELRAGTLILRASDVWHAVRPIHHLRRYITGSHCSRTRVSNWLKENVQKQHSRRRNIPIEEIPESVRANFFWDEA